MKTAFEKIKQGLEEAIAYTKGDLVGAVVHNFSKADMPVAQGAVGPHKAD